MDIFLYVLVGLSIGILSATFGVGGAFILTPILNVMGMPIILAIGTSLTFTVGISMTAGIGHFLRGNCSLKITGFVAIFTLIGVTVAYKLVQWLAVVGLAESSVGIVYIFMLVSTSAFIYRKTKGNNSEAYEPYIQIIPYLDFDEKKISLWNFVIVGVSVGFLKGFMGVGGGFILVPLLIWVIGMKPHEAVGTSLSTLFISSVYTAAIYALDDKVDYVVAAILIVSASIGSYYGLRAVNKCDDKRLTRCYSLLLLLSCLGILLKQIGFVVAGMYFSIINTLAFAIYVLYKFRGP